MAPLRAGHMSKRAEVAEEGAKVVEEGAMCLPDGRMQLQRPQAGTVPSSLERVGKRGWNRVSEEHNGWCEVSEGNADQMAKGSGFQWVTLLHSISEIHGAVFVLV